MKRLSTFLVALATTLVSLPVLADGVDMTEKLVNPDFEQGITGWSVDFTTTDNVNGYTWIPLLEHNEDLGKGHFGFIGTILWLETPQGVSPNATQASQTVKGLKNGTYVFSAMAAFATRLQDYLATGGYIFAGDNQVEGCDFNPYYCDRRSNFQAHTSRYQVAATVTDGTLTVGFRTIDGSTTYCAEADFCELWYFGDVSEEEALLEMGKIHYNKMKESSEELISGPITTEGVEVVQSVIDLTSNATTPDEYCWGEDTLRVTKFMVVNEIQKVLSLNTMIEAAKEVANGDYSEDVAAFQAQLKAAIELIEADIEAHTVTSDMVDAYKAELQEMINQVKVDELYVLNEQLFTFIYSPDEISEDNPLFGLTEHLGFGDDNGQFPYEEMEILEKLYEEVVVVLADCEDGRIGATEAMTYVGKIKAAVSKCIRNVNREETYTLPYYWVAVPTEDDPNVPITTRQSQNNEYLINNFYSPTFYYGESYEDANAATFRISTPLMKFDRAYKQITFTVNTTFGMGMNTTNDGPWFGIQEMYVLDGNGEEIPLTGEDFAYNSMFPNNSSSTAGLVDHDVQHKGNYLAQFLTNGSSQANRGNHWVCITFPEPVTEAKFIFESWFNDYWLENGNITSMTFTGCTESEALLNGAINKAADVDVLFGLEPATYPVKDNELKALVAEGKAMFESGTASDAEMAAMAAKIEKAYDAVTSVPMNKAVDGKEYYIGQEFSGFATGQGYKKSLTVFQDSILWFADADPADKNQKWILTRVEGDDPDDGFDWYTIQNVGTGKYMSTLIASGQAWEPTGEPINWGSNYMKLADKPAKIRVDYLIWGHIRMWGKRSDTGEYLTMQVSAHNNGVRSDSPVANGGTSELNPNGYSLNGVCGVVIGGTWSGGANTSCAWGLHEVVNTLPATVELSEQFGDETRHFATASKTFTFTADKPCAFENFKVFCYRESGQELSFTAVRTINSITITLAESWGDFRFSFDNKEGVKKVTISAETASEEKSAMEKLVELYNAIPLDYVEGTEVGNVKSLSDFSAAIATAENLLENGGTEAEYEAAISAIEEALAGLETVQPEAGKKYVIVNGYDAIVRSGQPVEYGIYFNTMAQAPGWTYLYPDKENYQWMFEAGAEEGTWYIMNVATGTYLGAPSSVSEIFGMSKTPAPYIVISKGGAKVNIRSTVDGSDANWNINQKGWTSNKVVFGALTVDKDANQSRWYIKEADSYNTGIGVVEDEMGRPVVQGVFDLTGRRVNAPTKGLYIIDGQKVLIK